MGSSSKKEERALVQSMRKNEGAGVRGVSDQAGHRAVDATRAAIRTRPLARRAGVAELRGKPGRGGDRSSQRRGSGSGVERSEPELGSAARGEEVRSGDTVLV